MSIISQKEKYQKIFINHKLVIVDDEKTISELTIMIFKKFFVCPEPSVFTNPAEALEYIVNNDVDFVITDLNTPIMTGVEMMKKANIIKPHLRGALLTGRISEMHESELQGAGFIDIWNKPVNLEKILPILANFFETHTKA